MSTYCWTVCNTWVPQCCHLAHWHCICLPSCLIRLWWWVWRGIRCDPTLTREHAHKHTTHRQHYGFNIGTLYQSAGRGPLIFHSRTSMQLVSHSWKTHFYFLLFLYFSCVYLDIFRVCNFGSFVSLMSGTTENESIHFISSWLLHWIIF